jgi:hypothetical protein
MFSGILSKLSFVTKIVSNYWIVSDGVSGTLAKTARDICYKWYDTWHGKPVPSNHHSFMGSWDPRDVIINASNDMTNYLEKRALCEKTHNVVFNSSYSKAAGLFFTAITLGHLVKNYHRTNQYYAYSLKDRDALAALSPRQVSAFNIGVQAGRNNIKRILYLSKYDAWRHPNAYFAGFAAARNHDNALIARVAR